MNAPTLPSVVPLHDLVALRITGPDAKAFLQGQLSNDTKRLTLVRSQLTSCNSSRGKVQAVFTLLERPDGLVALLPASMARRTLTRLKSYVLRAKVVLEAGEPEAAPPWIVAPVPASEAAALVPALPTAPGETVHAGALTLLRWWSAEERYLLVAPREAVSVTESAPQDDAWHRADIAAGLPQVYSQTHEAFIAQMLNLDILNGISFDKGCYTGQEIIARMRYRSTVKRRTLRFQAACPAPAPGSQVLAGSEHVGDVIEAVTTPEGCELLAVVTLTHRTATLRLAGPDVALQPLALPYAIPEADPEAAAAGQAS